MMKTMRALIQKFNMRPRNFNSFLLGAVLFVIFLVFSLVESQNMLKNFDIAMTKGLQQIIPRSLDVFLSFFSLAGSIEITTLALGIIFYLVFRKDRILLFSLGLFALMMVIELTEKFLIYHPGPPHDFFRYALPFTSPHYIGSKYSFPSGHVARTFFLVVVLLILVRKWIKDKSLQTALSSLLVVFAFLMLVSRIYLGEHWTSDVLGGMLLGGAMGFFAMVYY